MRRKLLLIFFIALVSLVLHTVTAAPGFATRANVAKKITSTSKTNSQNARTAVSRAPRSNSAVADAKNDMCYSILAKAKRALNDGNTKKADDLWCQAKAINPKLTKPVWLEKRVTPPERKPEIDDNQFLNSLIGLSYDEAKVALDERLLNDPANMALRKKYYDLAVANKDQKQVKRHGSVLRINQESPWAKVQVVILIIIVLSFVIELIRILKLVKPKKSGDNLSA